MSTWADMAVDQHGGRAKGEWAEIGADQLDIAKGQCRRRVRCRRCAARGGLRRQIELRLRGMSNPEDAAQIATPKAYRPGSHVIEDDAPAGGKALKLADGEGLGDVEEAEED